VNTAHTTSAKELDCKTIDTTVHTLFAAEFAMILSKHPPAFKPDGLAEVEVAFHPP